jgi:hypothetical protein
MLEVVPKFLHCFDCDVIVLKDVGDVINLSQSPGGRPIDDFREFSGVQAPTKSGRCLCIGPGRRKGRHTGFHGVGVVLSPLQCGVDNDRPNTVPTAGATRRRIYS